MERKRTKRWELGSNGAASDVRIIDPATGQQIGTMRKAKVATLWPRLEQQQRRDRTARWLVNHDRGQRGLSLKELRKDEERKRKQTRRKQHADREIMWGTSAADGGDGK